MGVFPALCSFFGAAPQLFVMSAFVQIHNGVVVSYAGKVDDDIWGTEFQFLIENNGTETYTVHAENISIDNTMYDGSMYAEVAAGKYANETMSFIGEELPAEMNELEFKLVISNSNYETVAESDPIKVSIQ